MLKVLREIRELLGQPVRRELRAQQALKARRVHKVIKD